MTWTLNAFGRTRAGVTGMPWRDLTDEEFERYTSELGDLSPYFDHQPAAPVEPPAPRRTTRRKA